MLQSTLIAATLIAPWSEVDSVDQWATRFGQGEGLAARILGGRLGQVWAIAHWSSTRVQGCNALGTVNL